jgi:hypothetical protein
MHQVGGLTFVVSCNFVVSFVTELENSFLPSFILKQVTQFFACYTKFPGGGCGGLFLGVAIFQCLLLMTFWEIFLLCLVTTSIFGKVFLVSGDWCKILISCFIHFLKSGFPGL